ncbi:hypothetical protein WJX73_006766 [Symbiochloris irregularis]|uniref:BTB domain-containing protein n=1 Tax=Symbiochloris irregularis TaxID=706552 RepID=A0AAW1NIS0_9CHLO
MNGSVVLSAVVENLRPDDIAILLENRGLPALGEPDELARRLQKALSDECCGWEWEQQDTPGFHSEIAVAGATMLTHGNCLYVFGGMDEERQEQMTMWRWNLSAEEGFESITYRGLPPKLSQGHYAMVYGDELWVFPGNRGSHMKRVQCCDLTTLRWSERNVSGESPPGTNDRKRLQCFLDGHKMLVFGGQHMNIMHIFNFQSRSWSKKELQGGHESWTFSHAAKRERSLYAFGVQAISETGPTPVEMWELKLSTHTWARVPTTGAIPPLHTNCSAAVVGDQWLMHGGRRAGKPIITNQTYIFNFNTLRWQRLLAEGIVPMHRECQAALGLQDCVVVVGGREDAQEYEPLAMACDTMATAVEILWVRPSAPHGAPAGRALTLQGMSRLCLSPHMSDVTLCVSGVDLPAHKQILAMHSRVFDRMWAHPDFAEASSSRVNITDLDPGTMRLLLQYMYGSLQVMPAGTHAIVDLLKAADKYDVDGLVAECMHKITQVAHIDDVAPLLQVAFERDSEELRAVCMSVAVTCLPNLVVSQGFQELVQTHPELGMQFVRDVTMQLGAPYLPDLPSPAAPPPTPSTPSSDVHAHSASAAQSSSGARGGTSQVSSPDREAKARPDAAQELDRGGPSGRAGIIPLWVSAQQRGAKSAMG